jgi:hypothetical protein
MNTSAEEAVREKEEETEAAQQAASAAVMANMRRAELDAEMNDLIYELIDYKVLFFNHSTTHAYIHMVNIIITR